MSSNHRFKSLQLALALAIFLVYLVMGVAV